MEAEQATIPTGPSKTAKRPHSEISEGDQNQRIGIHADFTPWAHSNIPQAFPPLPQIVDERVSAEVFTHPGAPKQVGVSQFGYDRWEWLGDAFLETMASCFIFQTFQNIGAGKASHLRELCVRNETLADYTRHYGLDKRAELPVDWDQADPNNKRLKWPAKEKMKVYGDLFEAYVGGLVYSDPDNGMRRASEWMKVLWGITLKNEIRKEEFQAKKQKLTAENDRPKNPKMNPKDRLQAMIGAKGVSIAYKDVPGKQKRDRISKLELFTVGCYLTGWGYTDYLLGIGSALGKKEAGQKAATDAFEKRQKLLDQLADKKKTFNDALQKQRQEDAEKEQAAAVEKEEQGLKATTRAQAEISPGVGR